MRILTNLYGNDEMIEYDHLLYINRNTNNIVWQVHAGLHPIEIATRFKRLAKIVNKHRDDTYQFAVWHSRRKIPICWFDIVLPDGNIISRDHAFDTTLIEWNGVPVPFGRFPFWYTSRCRSIRSVWPKYREYRIEKQSLIFIANKFKRIALSCK